MNELKKILVCAMSVSLIGMFFGCEQDSDLNSGDAGLQVCDDAGVCVDVDASVGGGGGTGGVGGQGGSGPVAQDDWTWVHILDISDADHPNTKGTPGVDICGVTFECPAPRGSGNGVEAKLVPGAGTICREGQTVGRSNCSATRSVAEAATGPVEDPCLAGSAPSDYVAIGVGGTLKVRVDNAAGDLVANGGLAGCSVTVTELVPSAQPDPNGEQYQIEVCSTEEEDETCFPFDGAYTVEGGGVGQLDVTE